MTTQNQLIIQLPIAINFEQITELAQKLSEEQKWTLIFVLLKQVKTPVLPEKVQDFQQKYALSKEAMTDLQLLWKDEDKSAEELIAMLRK